MELLGRKSEICQLYALNVSSNRFKVSRSLFLTAFVTTLFFIFTPYFSPSLPENRIQIIYFFGLIFIPVLIWRFVYMWIFFAPKYFKDIIVLSHSSRMTGFLNLISQKGFHNVICYVSDEESKDYGQFHDVKDISLYHLVKNKKAREVIVSTRGFSSDVISRLNNDIIALFEEGINIKSFESFYEEITDRVPKELLDHNFYKYINLSSSSDNKFYQVFRRILDIIISSIGLIIFLGFIPLIFIFNLIGNRGPLFYTQDRVGQKGQVFRIFKLRSMIVNAESPGSSIRRKERQTNYFFRKIP